MESGSGKSIIETASDSVSAAFTNSIEAGSSHAEALNAAIDSINFFMDKLDITGENSSEVIDSLTNVFNESISNGSSPKEAFEKALEVFNESTSEILESNNHENTKNADNLGESNEKFNLDFSYSPNTPEMNMLNDAMNKGMTVEEALKYVNDKMFPENVQGPPTLAEFNELKSNDINITKDQEIEKDEKELSKIEADMDAESGNLLNESSSRLDLDDRDNDATTTFESKDDDIS